MSSPPNPPPAGQSPAGRRKDVDPKWQAVDTYTMAHLHPPSRPNSSALTSALQNSTDKNLHAIFSSPTFGKFLALQARLVRAKHALEIGTLGGYAAIWLATENPELRVTTVEVDPRTAEVARENIANAGVSDRVTVRVGAALDVLPLIAREIEEGKSEKVGLMFVDADKGNNYNYLDWGVKLGYQGSVILVDNVVQGGKIVASEEERAEMKWDGVRGARDVIERVGKDERVNAVVMQHVCDRNYDGFLLAVVN